MCECVSASVCGPYTGGEELGGAIGLLVGVEGAAKLVRPQLSVHIEDILVLDITPNSG